MEISQTKSVAVKTEQKPGTGVTDAHKHQLPNHRRQVLEPKSIGSSENKVNISYVGNVLCNLPCNIWILCSLFI